MARNPEDLRFALVAAAESPPSRRDWWAERIASHGVEAIEALADWLPNPDLRSFALRTILLAAERGGQVAVGAAASALASFDTRNLTREELKAHSRAEGRLDALLRRSPSGSEMAPVSALVRGRLYRRRQLHASGLGGNVQKGISYPAKGDHVLLFSGGSGRDVYGYEDQLAGDEFRYYGEWSGPGDMAMTGGNAKIVDRSPNLYVLIGESNGVYRFEGRFEHLSHEYVPARRGGREARALTFNLRRVADRVDLE